MGWLQLGKIHLIWRGGHEDIEGGPEILGTCIGGGGGGSGKMIGSQGGAPNFFFDVNSVILTYE